MATRRQILIALPLASNVLLDAVLLLVIASADRPAGSPLALDILVVLGLGQLALVCSWLLLGSVGLISGLLAAVLIAMAIQMAPDQSLIPYVDRGAFVLSMAIASLPLVVLRVRGWRLTIDPPPPSRPAEKRMQFALAHILIGILVICLFLGLARASPNTADILLVTVPQACLPLLALPCLGVGRPLARGVLALILVLPFLASALVYSWRLGLANHHNYELLTPLVVVSSLMAYRSLGYGLVRSGQRDAVK